VTDHKELLKQLVDAPFGEAEKILRAKGLWEEKRAIDADPTSREYTVCVQASMPVSAHIRVKARSEKEAIRLAEERAALPSFKWDYDDGADDVNGYVVS
jgi:hypothetical protein